MQEVMEICDRAIFLKKGKIIADDVPKNFAKSVSLLSIRFIITDGMKRTLALASERKYPATVDHRMVEITIDEEKIPEFLHSLSQNNVNYAS